MVSEMITVGKSEIRKDAWEKVTGRALYTADIPIEGVRFGRIYRSPHHHARIVRIDTSKAKALSGVVGVITAEDIPGRKTFGPIFQDRPPLAIEKVRHAGEPIAIVVAVDPDVADRALELIEIEYELLPAVFDPRTALAPDAPKVHHQGNLLISYNVSSGDVQAGFSESDVILEETFTVPRISPAYLETESALAYWSDNETLTVWVSSQKPFEDRHTIAEVLNLPEERIQVKSAVIGGAFGGKEDSGIAVLAALAAWFTREPVRLVNNRDESFLGHPKRHPGYLHYRLGAKKDGTLMALEAEVDLDTGAYASYGPAVGSLLTEVVPGAYRIPNVRVNTRVVYTNSPFSGAMRGFGCPQAHFATESLIDMLAYRLNMDPIEVRRKNILRPGDRLFTGVVMDDTAKSLPQILDHVAKAREELRSKPSGENKVSGVGFALSMQSMGLGYRVPDDSTNRLEWLPDGRVLLYIGATDLGQGLATVAEQITAETLEIPYDRVRTVPVDTRVSPYGGVSCASRMTYLVGNSVIRAAQALKDQLLTVASEMLSIPKDQLVYRSGNIYLPDNKAIPAIEFVTRAAESGKTLRAEATFSFPYPEETTPKHLPVGMPHVKFCFGAQVFRVEVDPELGKVNVTDVVAIHDVGRVINPKGVEGQIEGGVVMGIGYALLENMVLKENGQWVDSFTEYLLPTTKDSPSIKSIIIEVPELTGPYGAKGVAEMSLTPTAPAIANAVFDAIGVRVKSIPIRPEDLIQDWLEKGTR